MADQEIVQVIFWLLGLLLMWRVLVRQSPIAQKNIKTPPRISVIIPARNEEHRIGKLLQCLTAQTLPPREVIVVDDSSSDRTKDVASEYAQVISSSPPPSGWTGKTWACWQGAQAGTGDLLLFLDADTWLEPNGIEQIWNLYRGTGLLSIQPYHATEHTYEQLSAFFNLVIIAAVGAFTPLGERLNPGGAFGPCLMVRRDEYFQVGGHGHITIREALTEDIPLAKLFLQHRLPVSCQIGQGIVSFRMYPEGLAALTEGWTRGMAYGAVSVNLFFSLATALWITGCFGACFIFARVLLGFTPPSWSNLIFYPVYAITLRRMLRQIGNFRWWTWALFPVPLFYFGVLVLRSILVTFIFKRLTWKGRTLHPTY